MGQDARKRVAVGGMAAARRDQRSGGIGGNELDQHPLRRIGAAGAVLAAGGKNRAQGAAVPAVGEAQIQKSGPGDFIAGENVPERRGEL